MKLNRSNISPSVAARALTAIGYLLTAGAALCATPPTLLTWQLDPYAQATENVIAAIERVTPAAEGGLVVDVGFNREPSEAPTVQFVYSTKGSAGPTSGGAITQVADGGSCSYPTQSMAIDGRWVYAYTLPATPVAIAPSRLTFARRCRFGGLSYSGRRLEGGGYAIVEGQNIYLGRSGTFVIGGQSFTFEGGILLEPTTPDAEVRATRGAMSKPATPAATYSLRSARAITPPNSPTCINGKRLSFPVKIKEAAE